MKTANIGVIQLGLKGKTSESTTMLRQNMLAAHADLIEEAGRRGIQVLGLQELLCQPYFCPSKDPKWFEAAERVPDGPSLQFLAPLARKHRMVIIAPVFEIGDDGVYYNTAAEFYAGLPAFEQLIKHQSARILQPEAPRCGGISEWRRIAKIALEAGLSVCPCWFHDIHAQLAPSTANVPMIECFPTFGVLNFGQLIDRPLTLESGKLILSEAPGLGFEFDMDMVRRHTVQ